MNVFKCKQRIRHTLKRQSEYSIHSPFMFDLYTQTIKRNRNSPKLLTNLLKQEFGKENILEINSSYEDFLLQQEKTNPNSILIIKNPYQTNITYKELQKILTDPRFILSVDLFDFVLLFYNPKLSQQHYIL